MRLLREEGAAGPTGVLESNLRRFTEADLTEGEIASAIGRLEEVQAVLWTRLRFGRREPAVDAAPSAPTTDRLLSPQEVAARLGVSKAWIYRNGRRELGAAVVETGARGLRFSARGLDEWIARRRGRALEERRLATYYSDRITTTKGGLR